MQLLQTWHTCEGKKKKKSSGKDQTVIVCCELEKRPAVMEIFAFHIT